LVFGAIVSTLLTLIVVPLIYYMSEKKKWEKIQAEQATEFSEDFFDEPINTENP